MLNNLLWWLGNEYTGWNSGVKTFRDLDRSLHRHEGSSISTKGNGLLECPHSKGGEAKTSKTRFNILSALGRASLLSVYVIGIIIKNNLEDKWIFLFLTHSEHSPLLREARRNTKSQAPGSKNWSRTHGRELLTSSVSWLTELAVLYTQDYLLRSSTTRSELGPLTYNINQENAPYTYQQAI